MVYFRRKSLPYQSERGRPCSLKTRKLVEFLRPFYGLTHSETSQPNWSAKAEMGFLFGRLELEWLSGSMTLLPLPLSLPLADKSLIRGNKFSSNHCTAVSTNGEKGCQLYRNVPIMCSAASLTSLLLLLLRLLQCFTCDTNDTWKVTHRRVERHDTSDFLWRCSKKHTGEWKNEMKTGDC